MRRQFRCLIGRHVVFVEFVGFRAKSPNNPNSGQILIHDAAKHAHAVLQRKPQFTQTKTRMLCSLSVSWGLALAAECGVASQVLAEG